MRRTWLNSFPSFRSDEDDYQKFASEFRSLEVATGKLVSLFGLDVHLIDASSLAEGECAVALVVGEYKGVDLVDWIALDYE